GANLSGCMFLFCLLENCTLEGASCVDANFGLSCIVRTRFDTADLTRASFSCAMMEDVSIRRSILDHADMTLVQARRLDITGSRQQGLVVERARVQGLVR
ncbi:MAG TPA: pentapeptide repeat-containing protein, partial [Deltaproteobacteria bacterium]|nr:pentapeptide repeat-containing protein [Deltaproteobacteria bacterium]